MATQKKTLAKPLSENSQSIIKGKVFLLAGPFDKIAVSDCTRKIEELGGKVLTALLLRSVPDYLIASEERLVKFEKLAQKLKFKLFSEIDFIASFPELHESAVKKQKLPAGIKSSQLIVPDNGILIGSQCWMIKNLDVVVFRNGDKVPEAKTAKSWKEAAANQQPAWCHYDNDKANGLAWGKLYNWYAITDPRGLAPEGWRIPNKDDWEILVKKLGGLKKAGEKMKSKEGWIVNGSNKSGFSAVPAGQRQEDGQFVGSYYGYFWTASENSENSAIYFSMNYLDHEIGFYSALKGRGYSLRAILLQ